MTKLDYSFLVPCVLMAIIVFYVVVGELQPASAEEYLKVTIQEGDTLWGLSEQYENYHELSPTRFISWVERENDIIKNRLFPGQEIILPVKLEKMRVVMNQ